MKLFTAAELDWTELICTRLTQLVLHDALLVTLRYDSRRYFNVRSKADISQLDLPHVGLTNN